MGKISHSVIQVLLNIEIPIQTATFFPEISPCLSAAGKIKHLFSTDK